MPSLRPRAHGRIHVVHNVSVTAGWRAAAEGVTAPSPMPRPRTRGGSAVLAGRAPGAAGLHAHRLARHLRGYRSPLVGDLGRPPAGPDDATAGNVIADEPAAVVLELNMVCPGVLTPVTADFLALWESLPDWAHEPPPAEAGCPSVLAKAWPDSELYPLVDRSVPTVPPTRRVTLGTRAVVGAGRDAPSVADPGDLAQ